MIPPRLCIIGIQLLMLTYTTQSLVMLTANSEDVKKLARRFVSDSLADKISEFIAMSGKLINTISEESDGNEIEKDISANSNSNDWNPNDEIELRNRDIKDRKKAIRTTKDLNTPRIKNVWSPYVTPKIELKQWKKESEETSKMNFGKPRKLIKKQNKQKNEKSYRPGSKDDSYRKLRKRDKNDDDDNEKQQRTTKELRERTVRNKNRLLYKKKLDTIEEESIDGDKHSTERKKKQRNKPSQPYGDLLRFVNQFPKYKKINKESNRGLKKVTAKDVKKIQFDHSKQVSREKVKQEFHKITKDSREKIKKDLYEKNKKGSYETTKKQSSEKIYIDSNIKKDSNEKVKHVKDNFDDHLKHDSMDNKQDDHWKHSSNSKFDQDHITEFQHDPIYNFKHDPIDNFEEYADDFKHDDFQNSKEHLKDTFHNQKKETKENLRQDLDKEDPKPDTEKPKQHSSVKPFSKQEDLIKSNKLYRPQIKKLKEPLRGLKEIYHTGKFKQQNRPKFNPEHKLYFPIKPKEEKKEINQEEINESPEAEILSEKSKKVKKQYHQSYVKIQSEEDELRNQYKKHRQIHDIDTKRDNKSEKETDIKEVNKKSFEQSFLTTKSTVNTEEEQKYLRNMSNNSEPDDIPMTKDRQNGFKGTKSTLYHGDYTDMTKKEYSELDAKKEDGDSHTDLPEVVATSGNIKLSNMQNRKHVDKAWDDLETGIND